MEILKFDDKKSVELVKSGEVIAFPTETVYGLGVRYDSLVAFNRLVEIKNRPKNKAFTLMISSVNEIKKYAIVDKKIERICNKYMPGPLTVILKARSDVPAHAKSIDQTIGIRCPDLKKLRDFIHGLAPDFIDNVGVPLLVPSANKSGASPCKSAEEIINTFDNEISALIDEKVKKSDLPSTIIDLSELGKIKLIREGGIEFKELEETYER